MSLSTVQTLEEETKAGYSLRTTSLLQRVLSSNQSCLLYTSDAADERSSVDLGGRRIIKKNNKTHTHTHKHTQHEKSR